MTYKMIQMRENNIAIKNQTIVNLMEKTIEDLKKNSIHIKDSKLSKEDENAIEEELKKMGYL